ncbi:acyl-CoA/acyl-ACP dehydrogenase [Mycobacterium sp. CVI_P3]|uniref:Acyl-CoA/acyl-ACP dehydrogenase n=1 Tax=Mycobacterium pinniadriaticum TaxID=2994102 RepID=A0ABT3SFN9_9MYCO|nr:acyl-CoA dehydrogenase family protein [Mycobacterium pinniadriaticum]MCX2931874.1 acyl-CoA/acyl-ACP dehydrogenase [Mycobacterium pinniadriaticum]MCX2938315.1 acyl-CoA/acyl-ACP dehydrogenase [Mycobacterium pinniadriaticum]
MPAALTTEQRDLADAVADVMAKRSPETEVRRLMATDTGYDPAVWAELAAMGLLGLAIPEALGGSGAGAVEVGLVMEAMGRALLCGPYLSTAVLTTNLLLALGDTREQADVLPRIAAGEFLATVAFAEPGSARPPASPDTTARAAGFDWLLSGTKTYVLDATIAQRIYVLAGNSIFAVAPDSPGLEISALSTVDQTRKQGRLVLRDTPARLVGALEAGSVALDRALDAASVALSGEQAGGAMHAMRMAADYAKTRFQFGRAIGSFQAVKHMCADMLLEAESALSAARHVAAAFDADDPDCLLDLAAAQAYCSEAFVTVAANTIQVHGGIGFTWEHPAHLYLRRARTDAELFGDPAWHRERYVRLREAQQ